MIDISQQELQVIANYIYEICGVKLDKSKEYLIKTRLDQILIEQQCATYSELYYKARLDLSGKLNSLIINAITTPETLFFRDSHPFDILKQIVLPELLERKKNTGSQLLPTHLRIWSAACSTGQEIYSIAMCLKDTIPDLSKMRVTLLATDISDSVLSIAKEGKYNQFEISRGLAKDKLNKHFVQSDNTWQVNENIRKMITFQKRNLMQPFMGVGPFDIVFCRNVAIYFTIEDRIKLFNKIADVIELGGYLFIGSSEFLTGICDRFTAIRHQKSIYYQLTSK